MPDFLWQSIVVVIAVLVLYWMLHGTAHLKRVFNTRRGRRELFALICLPLSRLLIGPDLKWMIAAVVSILVAAFVIEFVRLLQQPFPDF